MALHRYAIGWMSGDTFSIHSKHLFFHQALKAFKLQQESNLESALSGDSGLIEWAIQDMQTGRTVPLSMMVEAGYCTIIRK